MSSQGQPLAGSPSTYYCHICRKKFKNQGTLDSHVTSSKHKQQLSQQQAKIAVDRLKPPQRRKSDTEG